MVRLGYVVHHAITRTPRIEKPSFPAMILPATSPTRPDMLVIRSPDLDLISPQQLTHVATSSCSVERYRSASPARPD